MKLSVIQHVPFEGPGGIEKWAIKQGHELRACRLWQEDPLPSLEDLDMLVVMGGPMSVRDEDEYPWLKAEKAFLKEAIEGGKRVLGVCLGAQLIAESLGARVYPNPAPEVGWFPINIREEARNHPLLRGLGPQMTVFHWHGDTFSLPDGATPLLSSAVCENQAFLARERVLGLQFHLEMTEKGIQKLVKRCYEDLPPSPSVQPKDKLMAGCTSIPACQSTLSSILEGLAKL